MNRTDSDPVNPSRKRQRVDEPIEPSDRQAWYYPGVARDEDADELAPGTANGNWGKKHLHGARFVRRGHMAAWGPTRAQYDVEDRARRRLRLILPEFTGEPIEQDPILPHLRSPSPPMTAPYTPAPIQHTSYTSSVFDPNVGASFRSNLLNSLERSASELIQSEIALTRALGRFWSALTESANRLSSEKRHAIMQEQEALLAEQRQADSVPPVAPVYPAIPDDRLVELDPFTTQDVTMRMFTLPTHMRLEYFHTPTGAPEIISVAPQHQVDLVKRSMLAIRELQEDSKECMERLEEIREMLGKVKGLRDAVWAIMRSRAILEMENEE
ncbi:SubName: Full=Uncharacterized protein {ECO:0000313/EMBL:CCA68835.1} [Serendipita indica DSM 11827]|nr:SubName: Full=Uncharacterized protein {ECO:0000313/EMBL:CCA68835.1} [Serendipita indica DSM 11827]